MGQAGEYIRQVIAREGPISFARFMGLSLYGPGGYYRRGEIEKDYFTSPLAHPAFAAILALQLQQMARVLGQPGLGTLKPGSPADIVIFDPHREWVVEPGKFASKGKNTPLAGETLRGQVMATLVGGRLAFQHPVLKLKPGETRRVRI